MKKALYKNELIKFLKKKSTITTQEFWDFYRQFDPNLPITTVRWRIYELKQQGIIYSPKRGEFTLSKKEAFQPSPPQKADELAQILEEKFPYVRFSIYSTKWFGNLSNHLYNTNNLIVEIDADVLDAAFHILKEKFPDTFLSPNSKMYDYYILPQEENIIINRLYVDAPLNKIRKNYYSPKLEKLIVDLLVNDPIIFPVGISEVVTIIKNALDTYNINHSTLTRYANKRNVRQKLDRLILQEE
ncbi:hypothetical protein Q8E58_002124 [Listeria monocytogenes]|uniref:DUF6577 family protein n=1 Tax=Listeria monocytogenes TaxID=1639 RepID=UPI0011EAA459|nr:DUF6577 family protein [Listeria monocytogenes]EAF1795626.1 hypothetical protein [Listeria monocytogenes]EAG6101155.1 hypothetical protein [Listeria monocytogenes]EKZ1598891.1 hypothetical protein [Listeria monocytogenes]EKZ1610650.1 hypothetical protein [Listeria monocytogenes]EKZ1627946.1 hypothetical protein [Listeria monocytogenes]